MFKWTGNLDQSRRRQVVGKGSWFGMPLTLVVYSVTEDTLWLVKDRHLCECFALAVCRVLGKTHNGDGPYNGWYLYQPKDSYRGLNVNSWTDIRLFNLWRCSSEEHITQTQNTHVMEQGKGCPDSRSSDNWPTEVCLFWMLEPTLAQDCPARFKTTNFTKPYL